MSRSLTSLCVLTLFFGALLAPVLPHAQIIDFETLPGGDPTVDQQEISDHYAIYGVTFTLLDRVSGLPVGFPRIAKAGAPMTAFEGCFDVDTPMPYLDLGVSFLTDGTELGVEGDLLIEYASVVAEASGVIIDIDCRTNGGPPCEQWTITAYDELGIELQSVVMDGPPGETNPECAQPEAGPGDAEAFGWVINTGTAQIKSIILRYTGAATGVGLAFDHFSVAGPPAPLSAMAASLADTVCAGETVGLMVVVAGGLPPYSFQWQQEVSSFTWENLGTDNEQDVDPVVTSRYRVLVTDAAMSETTSNTVEVAVPDDDPLCDASLLVSSYDNDRIVRYSFRSRLASIFVPTGSGGLNGASKLIRGDDGHVYISSQVNDQILRYDGLTGAFKDVFVATGSGGLDIPTGLDFGPDGNLYVASYNTSSVIRYDGGDGSLIDTFVPNGSGLNGPSGLIFGPDEDLYVCSFNSDKVLRFDGSSGAPLGDFVTAGSGGLDAPRGLIFGPDGHLYVAEQNNDSVRRYDGTTGAFIDVFISSGSGGLDRANDVGFGPDGMFYVASFNNDKVLCYDGAGGTFLYELPNELLNGPAWIAIGGRPTATGMPRNDLPVFDFRLETGVPNPFNPNTIVGFTLSRSGPTRVTVVDVTGRVVATLLDGDMPIGRHTVEWDGRNSDGRPVSSGVYIMCVENGGARKSVKMVLLK